MSRALLGLTCPDPMARGVASLLMSESMIGFTVLSKGSAVVIMADLIAEGLHSGCAAFCRGHHGSNR